MVQICVKCGKKIGIFSNDPLVLSDDCILCFDCAEMIKNEINNLYYVKSIEEFNSLKDKILDFCRNNYDETTTNLILNKITNISNNRTFTERKESEKIENSQKRRNLIKNYMLTTGYEFYGYSIIEYVGIVSGQVVLGTGFLSEFTSSFADFFGTESNVFADKLETAKNAALEKLILKSNSIGGNALIGVDFDYITFHSNMIGVVANGTSVIIEKSNTKIISC